jgi:hypothetical protein
MAKSSIEKRRRMRELEAARDKHLTTLKKTREGLAKTRAELKHVRAN